LLTVVSIHLYIINHYIPLLLKGSLEATLIIWFLGNCRATLRVLIPCAGILLANMWCLSVKTQWRCGLWTMRALWMSLTAAGESSLHVLSILHIHPCLSLAVTRQVTFPCMSLLTVYSKTRLHGPRVPVVKWWFSTSYTDLQLFNI